MKIMKQKSYVRLFCATCILSMPHHKAWQYECLLCMSCYMVGVEDEYHTKMQSQYFSSI